MISVRAPSLQANSLCIWLELLAYDLDQTALTIEARSSSSVMPYQGLTLHADHAGKQQELHQRTTIVGPTADISGRSLLRHTS
jgi:hypothetical protein